MAKTRASAAFSSMRGKVGTFELLQTRNGMVMRPRTFPSNPRTERQMQVRANFTRATRIFMDIEPELLEQWRAYCKLLARPDPVTGLPIEPRPINVFTALACKFMQVNPQDEPPLHPPATPLFGDSVGIAAQGAEAKIVFHADRPNAAGAVTELLLQSLPSRNRQPKKSSYRTAAFVAFDGGSLTYEIDVTPGYYAAAYRFVNRDTGQETEIVPLGNVKAVMVPAT